MLWFGFGSKRTKEVMEDVWPLKFQGVPSSYTDLLPSMGLLQDKQKECSLTASLYNFTKVAVSSTPYAHGPAFLTGLKGFN